MPQCTPMQHNNEGKIYLFFKKINKILGHDHLQRAFEKSEFSIVYSIIFIDFEKIYV
jgi:hypothetical protein